MSAAAGVIACCVRYALACRDATNKPRVSTTPESLELGWLRHDKLKRIGRRDQRAVIAIDAGVNPSAVAVNRMVPGLPFDCTIARAIP